MRKNKIFLFLMATIFASLLCNAIELNQEDILDFSYTPPEKITREGAFDGLMNAEKIISEMRNANFTVYLVEDILLTAKRYYIGKDPAAVQEELRFETIKEKKDYMYSFLAVFSKSSSYELRKRDLNEVYRLVALIQLRRNKAFDLNDKFQLFLEKEKQLRKEQVNTSEALRAYDSAYRAFKDERYDQTTKYLTDAESALDKATSQLTKIKNAIFLTTAFVIKYWKETIVTLILIILIARPVFFKLRGMRAKHKLKALRQEYSSIEGYIKETQIAYLRDKTITREIYLKKVAFYQTRRAKLQRIIPVYEAIASGKKVNKEKIPMTKQSGNNTRIGLFRQTFGSNNIPRRNDGTVDRTKLAEKLRRKPVIKKLRY